MYYPDEIVEEVRSRSDIMDIVSSRVTLKRVGRDYAGLCPFHNEKTPSFTVSPSKQMYYCFGCGAGGNAISFLMEYENYSFAEALQFLAQKVGVRLPEREATGEEKRSANLREKLLEIHKAAAEHYYRQLRGPGGAQGLDYLLRRALTPETLKRFGLGYAGKGNDELYRHLKQSGYGDDLLKESGLVTIEERGAHDKFYNRVMFPIMDSRNRVIAFGGRVMGDGLPKYLNSPETKIFDKSKNLYGINYARTSRAGARAGAGTVAGAGALAGAGSGSGPVAGALAGARSGSGPWILCEGYMDVIALHQAGFAGAVASLGTSFTPGQAQLIKRYTTEVVLTYDSDAAGVRAALRAIPILKDAGISAKVIDLRPHKDPDEFIKAMGAEAFAQRLQSARNSFLYEVDCLKSGVDLADPEAKTRFHQEIAGMLAGFSDPLERDNYTQAVAREQFIPYEQLAQLVNRTGMRMLSSPQRARRYADVAQDGGYKRAKKAKEDGIKQSQKLLLTWLIERPDWFAKVKGMLLPEEFSEELYRQVAQMVYDGYAAGEPKPAEILNHFLDNNDVYNEVASLFQTGFSQEADEADRRRAFEETVLKVKRNSLEEAGKNAADLVALQEIIVKQEALKSLHIEFD
ncbi:MAG: DNA primase [Lachnospiraceae bacterium]|nr:DNA primase [Lachnospiraceae bacterium]